MTYLCIECFFFLIKISVDRSINYFIFLSLFFVKFFETENDYEWSFTTNFIFAFD